MDTPISENDSSQNPNAPIKKESLRVKDFYKSWFLDYASYVILERAIPEALDGLKPVQRRILHSMRELDDGRYSKVANLVGNTMKYHPHGDASIFDAMVQLGQKELLIDKQGNWGNILTGDGAAASRYIEARLTPLALDILFSPKITTWKLSYDGRNKEPENLPVKFPLLLFQGVEGIAVGLSTKILPHNFNEIIESAILYLQEKPFKLYPDFPTSGFVDVSQYKDGTRGGKVRIRAKINKVDNETIVIEEIPFGVDTNKLIESILKANEKGKIKIKKIDDNTAEKVEIVIHLAPKTSVDQTIDALYVFTDCEISISPISCVIHNEKPQFLNTTEILKISVDSTKNILLQELNLKVGELEQQIRNLSLERIFIKEKIYRDIEEQETWDAVLAAITKGMQPFIKELNYTLTEDDLTRLTEIRIKKISKFDISQTDENILKLKEEVKTLKDHIENIVKYTISFFKSLKDKYGKNKGRRTEIKNFETIDATEVAVNDTKLFVDKENGFIGHQLGKEGEFVCECSSIDDILIFKQDGTALITKISPKEYIGKDILHLSIYSKQDNRTIINYIYQDGNSKVSYMKRFNMGSLIRNKNYPLGATHPQTKVLYFSANPNGEGDIIKINLSAKSKARIKSFQIDLSSIPIKGKLVKGNILTKHPVRNIQFIKLGTSTLPDIEYWYDSSIQKITTEDRGVKLGAFTEKDKVITIEENGTVQLKDIDTSEYQPTHLHLIKKLRLETPIFIIYFDGEKEVHYIKCLIVTSHNQFQKRTLLPNTHPNSKVIFAHLSKEASITLNFRGSVKSQKLELHEIVAPSTFNAKGKKITFPAQIKEISVKEIVEEVEKGTN